MKDPNPVTQKREIGTFPGIDHHMNAVSEGKEFIGKVDDVSSDATAKFRSCQSDEWWFHSFPY
jgi:hypothetical protein